MRKTRNSFFSESSYQNSFIPQMPMQASTNYNSFYSGPNMQDNITDRLSKIERNINRLDHRVTKLEQNSTNYIDTEIDTNNMYML